jgi:hypothetical protein
MWIYYVRGILFGPAGLVRLHRLIVDFRFNYVLTDRCQDRFAWGMAATSVSVFSDQSRTIERSLFANLLVQT